MQDWIRALPKVELHCHLDGSLPRNIVESVIGHPVTQEELEAPRDCQNLADYLTRFSLPLACMQTPEDIRRVSEAFLLEAAKENVCYIETRFAPLSSVHDDLDTRTVIASVLDGLEAARTRCGTEYNVILCAMRHQTDEENLAMFETGREFLGRGVCAADLAGDEASYPMERFMGLFAEVRKMGYPMTIHAGEQGSTENILLAAKAGASRIGHGIAMSGHPEICQYIAERGIGIEMCPTSNLQTKAVDSAAHYPLREFLDAGIPVSINTDNRTVSGTTMTNELSLVQAWYNLDKDEICRLQRNAVETSFASDSVKERLCKLY